VRESLSIVAFNSPWDPSDVGVRARIHDPRRFGLAIPTICSIVCEASTLLTR